MRSAGVLMPITSLPSPWGIGTLGRSAREFLDFLAESGQTYWQLLPIGPTGYGDSPYQPFSSYAGNPYLIDLDDLAKAGLLLPEEYQGIQWGTNPARVDQKTNVSSWTKTDKKTAYKTGNGVLTQASSGVQIPPV